MKNVFKEILSTVLYLAVVFVLTFLFITFVAQRTRVVGHSMEPTLQDADSLIIEKVSYRFSAPKRFDIIVFPYEHGNQGKEFFVKRIIGLPGETIKIDEEGNIFVNGQKLEENYGNEVIEDPGVAINDVVLGDDEYFVMGDNRNRSMDSRFENVGNISKDKFLGRVVCRIFPFDKIGGVK
ncbi:signal peptidase I [Butyrivibrio hungatei]|uniref:signal peptidase I n=1 Tax=Butyrivibrio hungatei TaxID=185008 RepID=UPI000489E49F|nr:signal peptidase I [Butyrivibrio hungatei]